MALFNTRNYWSKIVLLPNTRKLNRAYVLLGLLEHDNIRAKCLAISQVLRAKSYNSCFIFIFYKKIYYYVVHFSFLLFLTYTSIWVHKYLCFVSNLVLEREPSSLLSFASAKLLTSLALSSLLYLLLGIVCFQRLFFKSLSHKKEFYYFKLSNKICL